MLDMISTFWALVPVTFSQSLIYAFVALGIMIPFRLLGFPDLTSEGAFPLGGCVCAVLLVAGVDPVFAMLAAAAVGFLAGCSTAFIHLRFGINTLLAGILVMTMLWSINLRILGKSNIALFSYDNIFMALGGEVLAFNDGFKIALVGGIVLAILGGLLWFFNTEKGLGIRAVGANPDMSEASGISIWKATILGVGAASGLTALGGSILVQSQGFVDINMGFGVLINGLAALIIGEAIVGRRHLQQQLIAPVIGAVVYYQAVSMMLSIGLPPSDLKLATGAFVVIMLATQHLRKGKGQSVMPEKIRE